MTASSYATGLYTPAEASLAVRGRYATSGNDRLLIGLHGTDAAPTVFAQVGYQVALGGVARWLADTTRYGVLAIDAGGQETWGNDTSLTAVAAAITYARGAWANPTAKVGLLAYSMGGAVALNYANNHPSDIAGVVAFAPVTNLDTQYAESQFTADIDAAYGGSYATNGTGHNPQGFAATMTTPMRLHSAVDDTTVPNSEVHAFYDALTVTNKSITDLPGGGHLTFWQYVDLNSIVNWLDNLSWS